MNKNRTLRLNMFRQSISFCNDNSADFADAGDAIRHIGILKQIITDIERAQVDQAATGATGKDVLVEALRVNLQNISRTATAIAQDEPAFDEPFALRSFNQNALLTAADRFQKALAKPDVASKFIGEGLPPTFVQDLAGDRERFAKAVDEFTKSRLERVASTAAIQRLIASGMKEVNYLDAVVHHKYSRMPDKLRTWESASHIVRQPKGSTKPAPSPTVDPQPNPHVQTG